MIPPSQNAAFCCAMEEVLDVYQQPYEAAHPTVNLDEQPVQLIGEVRSPIPARPGRPARVDYEYVRNGTANIFMLTEPLAGFREVIVTERRTAMEFAEVVRHIMEDLYPNATCVTLVMDNLSTHVKSSLYERFEPARAQAILSRTRWVHTPKHGSWLNVAECELSVMTRQCLSRRIADLPTLRDQTQAWAAARNASGGRVDWQFTTADARLKLKRLYPVTQA